MNQYTITNVDMENKMVYAHFIYNSHELDHRELVGDPTSPTLITQAIQAAYAKFQVDMNAIDNSPTIPSDVQALIGQIQTVS